MSTSTFAADQAFADRIASDYGVQTEGMAVGPAYHAEVENIDMTLAEIQAAGGHIHRVRMFQERGRCDISYIHATLGDGRMVRVNLAWMPSSGLGMWRREVKGEFIAWAKAEKVYAKGLGLLDESNWSILH